MPSPVRTDELVLLSPLTVGPVNVVCMNCLKSVQVVQFLYPLLVNPVTDSGVKCVVLASDHRTFTLTIVTACAVKDPLCV